MNHDETNSNPDPHVHAWIEPELEARVVAWVAGEASAFEVAELERLIVEKPELALFKQRIEAVHGLIAEAGKPEAPALRMSEERREKLLAAIGAPVGSDEPKPVVLPAPPASPPVWSRRGPRLFLALSGLAVAAAVALFLAPNRFSDSKTVAVHRESDGRTRERMKPSADTPTTLAEQAEVKEAGVSFRPTTQTADDNSLVRARRTFESSVAQKKGAAPAVPGDKQVADVATPSDSGVRLDAFAVTPPPSETPSSSNRPPTIAPSSPVNEGLAQSGSFASGAVPTLPRAGAGGSAFVGEKPGAILDSEREAKIKGEVQTGTLLLGASSSSAQPAGKARPGSSDAEGNLALAAAGDNANATFGPFQDKVAGSNSVTPSASAPIDPASLRFGERVSELRAPVSGAGIETSSVTLGVPVAAGTKEAAQNEPVVKLHSFAVNAPAKKDAGESVGTDADQNRANASGLALAKVAGVTEELSRKVAESSKSGASEVAAAVEPVSTFSLHVSDVSFRLAVAAMAAFERGENPKLPEIRPEEFYNAFDYGDPATSVAEKVSARIEQSAHPVLQQRNLLRIALQVAAAGRGAGQPLRLTVLLDTSGSMERDDRRLAVRRALVELIALLGPDDRISLVGFARQPRLLAENVPGNQAGPLVELSARTPAEGGTNLEEAMKLAGQLAVRHRLAAAQNRIVLLTDGAANLGNADPAQLATAVDTLRQQGIAFDACGIGLEGTGDTVLEALTRRGDGRYYVIDRPEAADASFARQLAGAFRPAAENVKLQVRFNPARVGRYRLIGFEQHRLRTEDFRNDKVDAAELAAEEGAIALYQVEVLPEGSGEVGEVFVRFRDPANGSMVERSWTIRHDAQAPRFDQARPLMQLAGMAMLLADKLGETPLAAQFKLGDFARVVNTLRGHYAHEPRVQELVTLFGRMRRINGE